MTNTNPDAREFPADADVIPLAIIARHETAIRAANPQFGARETFTIRRLAHLYYLLDVYGALARIHPDQIVQVDWYQKLASLALRHEQALGITKPAPDESGGADALPSIRIGGAP